MKKTTLSALLLATSFLFAGDAHATGAAHTSFTAAGSGVNLGITHLLAEAFMKERPDVKVEVPGSIGSRGAITAVTDGALAIGLISRPLQEKEKVEGIVVESYARAPIVIAVHPSVEEESISSKELIDIFKGVKTKWADGNDIVVYSREPYDSGFLVLGEKIEGFSKAYAESAKEARWLVNFTDQDSNNALAKTPYAIGVTDMGMIVTEHLNVKPLALDGIAPGVETLRSGAYKLTRDLHFMVRPANLSPEAKAFMEFVRSDKGKAILEANAYLPLSP